MLGYKIISTKKLQALEEGSRDILNTSITDSMNIGKVVDKNNYKTYSSQVDAVYKMYNSEVDYGGELLRGIVDTRVIFIAGEGISIIANKKKTQKYIDKFMYLNKLYGSRLITMVQTGEMEGRNLLLLFPSKKEIFYNNEIIDGYIKVRSFSWWVNKYSIAYNALDTDEIKSIEYKEKKETGMNKNISPDKAVYIRLGGSEDNIEETPGRIHCVLTDIENFSRTKYDLRKNHHLFAKIMPYFKTQTRQEAQAINNDVNGDQWEPGKGYAGTADFSLISPPLGALEAIRGEMLLYLKNVATTTGIPIHWLSYPELMSNRATAENLLEVINAATKKERLLWEEGIKEMIYKSMIMSIDNGLETNEIMGDFVVKLDQASISAIKALQEVWAPLQQLDAISMATLRSKMPGIDPEQEKKLIENEKKENMERFTNGLVENNSGEKDDESAIDDSDQKQDDK